MIKYYRVLLRFRKKVFLLGKHGTLLFKKSMPFLFVATVSSLFYLLCLKLGSMDFFHYLISKMGFSLGSRVLLSRGLGCEGWLLLILAAFGIFDGTILNMTGGNETVNQGPHRGDAGPSSILNDESDSESWRKYLNSSSSTEGNAASQPSTARAPNEGGHQATSQPTGTGDDHSHSSGTKLPLPSTDSSPVPSIGNRGESWIDNHFGTGSHSQADASSSPPAQGQPTQPAPASAASDSMHHSPPFPTKKEVESELDRFLSSFSKRKARADFIINTEGLHHASPEKLAKIMEMMETISNGPNKPNSGRKASELLIKQIKKWAEGG